MGLADSDPDVIEHIKWWFRILGFWVQTVAIFVMVISSTGYRKGEKWAWYSLLYLPGDHEPFCEFRDGVVVQLVVFEKSLPLFAHGNTFPGHGHHLLHKKCYPCP